MENDLGSADDIEHLRALEIVSRHIEVDLEDASQPCKFQREAIRRIFQDRSRGSFVKCASMDEKSSATCQICSQI